MLADPPVSSDRESGNSRTDSEHVFIQEKEVVLTNEVWKIIIDLDVEFHENTVTELRADLQDIYRLKSRYAPIHELRQVENLLADVEHEISSYRSVA
jgi:hypothetical protein